MRDGSGDVFAALVLVDHHRIGLPLLGRRHNFRQRNQNNFAAVGPIQMSGLIDIDRRHPAIRNALLVILGLAMLLFFVVRMSSRIEWTRPAADMPSTSVAAYIASYRTMADPLIITLDALTQLDTFCYNMLAKQLRIEEQIDRDETFELQKFENIVLLWMVVAITLAGVGLAGLQLLGSYQLAKAAGQASFMA